MAFLGTVDYGRGGRIFGTTWAGALSVSDTSFTPAYAAGASWNFATGLGSLDAYNLVTNWGKGHSVAGFPRASAVRGLVPFAQTVIERIGTKPP